MNADIEADAVPLVHPHSFDVTQLTITGYAILQIPTKEEDPVIDLGSTRNLASNGEHLKRTLNINGDWQQLEYGWVKNPSAIVLSNVTNVRPNNVGKEAVDPSTIQIRQVGAQAYFILPAQHGQVIHLGSNCVFEVRSDKPTQLLILVTPE
jgi:hypothetical protein